MKGILMKPNNTESLIGLKKTTENMLMKVARKAFEPQEGIHHDAGPVTPDKAYAAMIAANAMGKKSTKVC